MPGADSTPEETSTTSGARVRWPRRRCPASVRRRAPAARCRRSRAKSAASCVPVEALVRYRRALLAPRIEDDCVGDTETARRRLGGDVPRDPGTTAQISVRRSRARRHHGSAATDRREVGRRRAGNRRHIVDLSSAALGTEHSDASHRRRPHRESPRLALRATRRGPSAKITPMYVAPSSTRRARVVGARHPAEFNLGEHRTPTVTPMSDPTPRGIGVGSRRQRGADQHRVGSGACGALRRRRATPCRSPRSRRHAAESAE